MFVIHVTRKSRKSTTSCHCLIYNRLCSIKFTSQLENKYQLVFLEVLVKKNLYQRNLIDDIMWNCEAQFMSHYTRCFEKITKDLGIGVAYKSTHSFKNLVGNPKDTTWSSKVRHEWKRSKWLQWTMQQCYCESWRAVITRYGEHLCLWNTIEIKNQIKLTIFKILNIL